MQVSVVVKDANMRNIVYETGVPKLPIHYIVPAAEVIKAVRRGSRRAAWVGTLTQEYIFISIIVNIAYRFNPDTEKVGDFC